MERLSSTTINCGSRVLLQLSLFPTTQNRSNRKKIRSQPKFMNQIPILLFLCILINSFYQIYSFPEIPNFSGKRNLTSPLLSSLSIRKNASSRTLSKGSSSPSTPITHHGKATANLTRPLEAKEHHSSSHSPSSSITTSDPHKNAQEKSSNHEEHSTYSHKHLDRSESMKNNSNATVRGIREAGVEEKLDEGGSGESDSGESSPNSATENQSTTGSPTTGDAGK